MASIGARRGAFWTSALLLSGRVLWLMPRIWPCNIEVTRRPAPQGGISSMLVVKGASRGCVWIGRSKCQVPVSKSCTLESGPLSNARTDLQQSRALTVADPCSSNLTDSRGLFLFLPGFCAVPIRGQPRSLQSLLAKPYCLVVLRLTRIFACGF